MGRNTKIGMTVMAVFITVSLHSSITETSHGPPRAKTKMVGQTSAHGYSKGYGDHPGLQSNEALAALTVYYEAAGESFAGKLAVAAVIRNRMKMKYQSDGTVKGTVLRSRQFQPWNTRNPSHVTLDLKKKSMRDSLLAWRLVQDGRNVVDGAVLFYNPRVVRTPYWAKVSQKVTTIGGHEFYIPPTRRT